MDIDVTDLLKKANMRDYSASVAEAGPTAGADTWKAAVEDYPDYPLLDTDEKRTAFRAYLEPFGAWDAAEVAAMTDAELNALCIQMVASEFRDGNLDKHATARDWRRYTQLADKGQVAGCLFKSGALIYFSLAH